MVLYKIMIIMAFRKSNLILVMQKCLVNIQLVI